MKTGSYLSLLREWAPVEVLESQKSRGGKQKVANFKSATSKQGWFVSRSGECEGFLTQKPMTISPSSPSISSAVKRVQ